VHPVTVLISHAFANHEAVRARAIFMPFFIYSRSL
jgi:hypothetical protein